MKKFFVFFVFVMAAIFLFPQSALAVTFDLLAPSGQLYRDQNVNFTVNIDTEGRSFTSTQIGMMYDANVLEYVSTSPGKTFTTVSADPQGGGKIIITGSSTSGYSGSGSFAIVTFKIIAQSSGSTQLCTLFNPTTPTSPPSVPTAPPAAVPTNLPKTGSIVESGRGIISGLAMIMIAAVSLFLFKKA